MPELLSVWPLGIKPPMMRLNHGVKYLVDKFNFYVKVALSFLCTSSLSAAMPTFLETDLTEAFPGAVRRGRRDVVYLCHFAY